VALTAVDYLILAGYLAAITAFGSYFARFQKTTRDYFLTGRSVPWWAVCFTIVATETSTLTFIGVPAASFAGDMRFLQLVAGYLVGRVLVALVFVPAYFSGELVTSYELLQHRFGRRVKWLAAGIFLITRSLADGVRLFATALVISVVTGIPDTLSILLLGTAMIVYSVRGGVSAVIWTDVVPMFVYAAGAMVIFASLLHAVPGGWPAVVREGFEAGKFRVIDVSLDPSAVYTVWSGLIGGVALTLATHGTDQFLVQRLLSARSARHAASGIVLSGVLVLAQFTLFLVIGVMLYVYYQHVPPPRTWMRTDEVLPAFVVSTLTHGTAGFIVAGIVAAALSPSLNAMASTTVNDFYRPMTPSAIDESRLLFVSRIATLGWGVVQIAVALAARGMDRSVLDAGLAVLSFASGSVLGVFLLGTLRPAVREWPALAGMLTGLATMAVVWWATPIAWTWYVAIGATTTWLAAVAIERLSAPRGAGAL
jgi:SSS family transporter